MVDELKNSSATTVALTATRDVSLAPEAVRLLAALDGAGSAEKIGSLRAAVRRGSIAEVAESSRPAIFTQFPDGSPSPGTFKDK